MIALARVLPTFLIAFLCGVFIESLTILSSAVLLALLFLSFVLFLVFVFEKTKWTRFALLVTLGFTLGAIRFLFWYDVPLDPLLSAQIGEKVTLSGMVIDEPDVRERNTHLTVELDGLQDGGQMGVVSGTILLFTPRYPEYQYGDHLLIHGKLSVPQEFQEADGRVFDYPSYLRTKGIRYQMAFARIEQNGKLESFSLRGLLFSMKHRFQNAIGDALPEPQSSLLSGLLLGGKQSLGTELLDRFKVAGIIHIVVLSGYNMTIVAEWLTVLFGFLGFFGSLSMGAIGISLFAMMTGGGATVLRAAILALFVLLARATGRLYEMGRALLLAGAMMVLFNPSILLFDPSFQLSFLASLGLVYLSPIINRRLSLWKKMPLIREVLVSTLSTQVAVLPLLLFQTGMFSLVSLPANLLVLPFIPLTMLLGFIAGMFALLIPSFGIIAGFPAYLFLSYIISVADQLSRFSYSAISAPVGPMFVAVSYVFLLCLVWYELRHHSISPLSQETNLPPS